MVLWSCGEMWSGASHTKRYRTPSAGPLVCCGHTSTLRNCRRPSSKRTTIPPTIPEPEAVDHTILEPIGSGGAQPLSPPPTECHSPREIPAPRPPGTRELDGPRYEGSSCLLPSTLYGISLSTVTW